MKSFFICAILIFAIQSCSYDKAGTATVSKDSLPPITEVMVQYEAAMDTMKVEASFEVDTLTNYEPDTTAIISATVTKLKFQNFNVILHGFKSVMISSYYEDSGNIEQESEDDEEVFKLIESDTAFLSEDLDERINNTLIQIIPSDQNDEFRISMGYITNLCEVMDHRNHSQEEINSFNDNWKPTKEKTKFVQIKDSADYFFRALPHTPDMEEVTVVNEEVVPVKKRNTEEQINSEKKLYEEELIRIKNKYKLKDTFVTIPGEYDIEATLTKNRKLFLYNYDSFLFRIDRYKNKKLKESKYVLVWISYGC